MAYLKINIESWEAYNSGYLLGRWHDVTELDLSELQDLMEKVQQDQTKQLNKLLNWSHSNCEELFAPDIETDLPIEYSENGIIDMFNEFQDLKELLESETEETIKLAQAIRENEGKQYIDLAEALEKAQGASALDGHSESMAQTDLAYQLMESTGELDSLPDHISRYFNYEAFGRDLILGGDYSIYNIDGNYYAVSSH